MSGAVVFRIIVFVSHYFFFGLAALFYLLKFHNKERLKFVIFSAAALWIIFSVIDFIFELKGIL